LHRVNLGLGFSKFRQNLQRFGGLSLVDPAHGKADMDQHPIADTGLDWMCVIDDADNVDLSLDATDIDGREFPHDVVDPYDTTRDA
jgi:hypothetical protein